MFLLCPVVALAQPNSLYKCVTWGTAGEPNCGQRLFSVLDPCDETLYIFQTYRNRATWFPLKNDGPITVETWTRGGFATGFPLYVAIVPLPDEIPPDYCAANPPGTVIGQMNGARTCGGAWESIGPQNIDTIVPRGGTYALQLVSYRFFHIDLFYYSPAFNCVRVTSEATAVTQKSWGQIKALYQ